MKKTSKLSKTNFGLKRMFLKSLDILIADVNRRTETLNKITDDFRILSSNLSDNKLFILRRKFYLIYSGDVSLLISSQFLDFR